MAETFADLGIPFPLFEAPVGEASDYAGVCPCRLCHRSGHCFRLGVGADLVIPCPACGQECGLDADDREGGTCPRCRAAVPFSIPADVKELKVCYNCLRVGRAAMTVDTEFGMIRWEDAVRGATFGLPGLDRDHPEYEAVPCPVDDTGEWVGLRLPREQMFELVRTPGYVSWQGERWLFCCKQPMIYVGGWDEDDFERHASGGDGRAYFLRVIPDAVPEMWGGLAETYSTYVFRCPACGRHRGHHDTD